MTFHHGDHLLQMPMIILSQHLFLILSMHDLYIIYQRRQMGLKRRDVPERMREWKEKHIHLSTLYSSKISRSIHFVHADDGIVDIVVLQSFGPVLRDVFGRQEDFATNVDASSATENDGFAGKIPVTVRGLSNDSIQAPAEIS